MSITGLLPCPLGKVAAINVICPLQWYDECETMDPQYVEAAAIACDTPAANHTPSNVGCFATTAAPSGMRSPHASLWMLTPPKTSATGLGSGHGPIGMLRVIHEEDQGCLNEGDLDVWLWYRVIIPKTHDSLFERLVWHDIFLTPRRFIMLMGNPKCPSPLLAQLRDCPLGRCWAWPNDTTPDAVPPERIACWLATSAGITANRAQCWLEPYAQCL